MSTELFSDQLRRAISKCGLTQYAICHATGINKGNLSRFMSGDRGMGLSSVDKIVSFLDLRLEAKKRSRQTKPGTDRP
jgi:hypothetical protein